MKKNEQIKSEAVMQVKRLSTKDRKTEDIKKDTQKKKHKNFIEGPPKPNRLVYTYSLTESEERIRAKLIELFPKLFVPDKPKPLARKIHKEIDRIFKEIGYEVIWKEVTNVLCLWTGGLAYKKAVIQEKHRYDLEGNPVDEVLLREKQDALAALEYFLFYYNIKKAKEERLKNKIKKRTIK